MPEKMRRRRVCPLAMSRPLRAACMYLALSEEQRHNPRVVGKSLEEFDDIMANLDLSLPKKIMEAAPTNRLCGMLDVNTELEPDIQEAPPPK